MDRRRRILGGATIALSAGIWGLFWIPLRYLDQNGLSGLWAVAITLAAAAVLGSVMFIKFGRLARRDMSSIGLVGLVFGLSTVCYFSGVIYSDVVRVILLFYLLPVWATLTAFVLFHIPIRKQQLIFIGMALVGLFLLLGGDGGVPLPRNFGDWMGLAAGFLWGLGLTLVRGQPEIDPYANSVVPFVVGVPFAIALALVLKHFDQSVSVVPDWTSLNVTPLIIAFLFGALILWPAMFGQIWGARFVSSSTAALLTMSEILLATLSAWLIIGTELGGLSLLGGVIIITTAVLDLSTTPPE